MDNKETISNIMALSDIQKEFFSFLNIGSTIVFSQGWGNSIQVQIIGETGTGRKRLLAKI